ncbi:MAG: ATP-binding protein [Anaeromyxobacteraceae bacterium]
MQGRSSFYLGLRGRLTALALGAAGLILLGLLALLPSQLDAFSRRWAESRSLGIAHVLARACAVPLDFDDDVAAARALSDLEGSEGARYAVLVRPDGSRLARWGQAPDEVTRAGIDEGVIHLPGLLRVTVSVVAPQAGRGALVLGFDTLELERRREQTRLLILAITLAVTLLLAVPAAILGARWIHRPLARVTAVAERVASGDMSAPAKLPVDRRDEIGTLARSFAHMLDRLYEKEAGIAAAAARLEQAVDERTADLARANEELAQSLAELRRTQEQLVAADRRITIGRLTAGVSHEINNPLAYIKANLDFVQQACEDLVGAPPGQDDPARTRGDLLAMADSVRDALSGVERVRYIVRGLKNFSRDDADERHVVKPADPLRAAIDMARHELKGRARLVEQVGPMPAVLGHEVRLSQVFLNLLVNAAQAIPEGAPERHEVRVEGRTGAGGEAVVEVKDTGCGIGPEARARLFEPFFTTKPLGVGTGLGLSICKGIVEGIGGRIEVETAPGAGSTFRVVLPPAPSHPPAGAARPRRTRVLIVDDEPMVRSALERSLGRDHEVRAAPGAREALALLDGGAQFDRILCDVNMPGMDGFAFRDAVAEHAPEMADLIVFMTGAVLDPARRAYLSAHALVCLEKPLDPKQLASVLDANV